MLEKALFVAKLFLDCREKLLSEDAFVSFSKSLATAVELTMFWKLFQFILHQAVWIPLIWAVKGPCGLMDRASASEAGDCGFKSHLGRF